VRGFLSHTRPWMRSAAVALLENWSIATVKYGCNMSIFVAIPSNNNNVTLVKIGNK
jgi:hypothetical protein